jgi:hypothetical protein
MKRALALITSLTFTVSAQAGLINLTVPVGWSCATGTGGFEPTCDPAVETGWMSLTYLTDVADSDTFTTGRFENAIVDFSMTVAEFPRLRTRRFPQLGTT